MHLMQLVPQLIYLVLKHMSPTTQNEIILWYGELPNLFIFFSISVFFLLYGLSFMLMLKHLSLTFQIYQ